MMLITLQHLKVLERTIQIYPAVEKDELKKFRVVHTLL